jgi:RHS repeat-associated protein
MRYVRITLTMATAMLVGGAIAHAQTEYSAPKFDEARAFDALLPQETVDLFNGALQLTYRDIHLPGPNGFDLDIIRWYNSKINQKNTSCVTQSFEETSLGIGWHIHLGRITGGTGNGRRVELPGGIQETFYDQATISVPTNALLSRNYWLLEENVFVPDETGAHDVVTSPAGIKYRFLRQNLENNYYYLTSKVDPTGNKIEVTYEVNAKQFGFPKTATDAFGRVVTFVYAPNGIDDPDKLTKIQVKNTNGSTVEYLYNVGGTGGNPTLGTSGHQGLLSVTTPLGLQTVYNYDLRAGETSEDVELKQITLPTGQQIRFYYNHDKHFTYPCTALDECTSIVTQREVPGVGNWNYTFPTGAPGDETTIVEDPLGNEERSTFGRYTSGGASSIWKVGLLLHREVEGPTGGVLQAEDYTYSSTQISSRVINLGGLCSETVKAKRLDERTVTSSGGGSSKTASVEYSGYESYGNPGTIKEFGFTGSLIRQKNITYAHGAGGQWTPTTFWILDRPKQITLKDSDGTTTRGDTKYTYYTGNSSGQALGRVQREERFAETLSDFNSTSKWLQTDFEYDTDGDVSKRTYKSSTGDRVTTFVNQYGVIKSATDQEGLIFNRTISQSTSLITDEFDANNQQTSYTYDNQNRLTKIDPPTGSDTDIQYDNADALFVVVKRGFPETRYEYDGLGRVVLTRRRVTSNFYSYDRVLLDAVGRVSKRYEADYSDPSGTDPAVTTVYDALGRPTSVQDVFGTTLYTYGPDTAVVDEPGTGTKTLTRDALGRLITVLDEANNTTSYIYDPNDHIKTVSHPVQLSRQFAANDLGWTLHETHPESGLTRFEYNDFGELVKRVDANGRTTTFTYDARARIKTSVQTSGTTTTFFYDGDAITPACPTCSATYTRPLGNRTGMVDQYTDGSSLVMQWPDYDGLNRPLAKRTVIAGATFVESVTYDAVGNLEDRAYPKLLNDPDRATLTWTYNYGNKPTDLDLNVTTPLVNLGNYNAALAWEEITLGNGVKFMRPTTPSLRNRPDHIRTFGALNSAGGSFADIDLNYDYDARGRVGQILRPTEIDTYSYSARNELASISYSGIGSVIYSYDANGNMGSVTSTAFPQLAFTRTHSNNRINGLTYDSSGHLLGDGVNNYVYDAGGRLLSATPVADPTATETFAYDGESRRRIVTKPGGDKELFFYSDKGELLSKFHLVPAGTPSPIEDVFYFDGERLATRRYPELSEFGESLDVAITGADVVLDWDAPTCTNEVNVLRATDKLFSDETVLASGLTAETYTDAGEGSVYANKFYLITAPEPSLHYHFNDHLGSTRAVIDQDDRIEATYEYFAYGQVRTETCAPLSGGFHGKERDAATGIDDLGIRFYAPGLSRFLTPDPTKDGIDLTRPISWNAYLYNLNNPIEFVDPNGASWKSWIDTGASVFVGFVPGVGDAYDLGSALVGIDLVTGEELSTGDRLLTGLAAVVPFVPGKLLRGAKEGAELVGGNHAVREVLTEAVENFGAKGSREGLEAAATSGKARFIAGTRADEIVDTLATPPGRYIQPDRSATDILQQTSHPGLDDFTSRTHTHPARIDVNPSDPSRARTTLLDPRPITFQEIMNIINGTAVPSAPRGR